MTHLEQVAATLAVLAAGTAGVAYLVRGGWRFLRAVQNVHNLIQRELSQNSGGSMKDEVAAIAVHVGQLEAGLRELTDQKDTAHQVLQHQLDSIMSDMGTPDLTVPTHRRERDQHGPDTEVVHPQTGEA